jgi:hypothetical protein
MRYVVPVLLTLSLSAAQASAGPLHQHKASHSYDDSPVYIRAEVQERTTTFDVPVPGAPVGTTCVGHYQVPVTRTVPVCVTDPHTGCTHTEHHVQTGTETFQHAVIEVVPPQKCGTRKEEKVDRCITIFIQRVPGCPAGAAPGH